MTSDSHTLYIARYIIYYVYTKQGYQYRYIVYYLGKVMTIDIFKKLIEHNNNVFKYT